MVSARAEDFSCPSAIAQHVARGSQARRPIVVPYPELHSDGVEFPPPSRIDTRLTVIDWPLAEDEELAAAVTGVTTFELANAAPALVEDGTTRHLAWRGYLTGGLLTLYERLGPLLSERGLSAFYADPRLEVFVPCQGEVVVLGALRHPIRVDRADWDARVAAADDGNELAEGFLRSAMEGAGDVIEQVRRAAQEHPHPLVAPRPQSFGQRAPGEVEFDLLEESDFELTERFDPEGNAAESWVSCRVLRWRTDFVPPGTVREPDQRLEDALSWRVSQWQWVPEETEDEDEDAEHEWGEWALRAHSPIDASTVAERLPQALMLWVRRRTEQAVELFDELETDEPAFAAATRRLKAELDNLP